MTQPPTLGYLCSVYARVSHSFIRGEVARLRELGHEVHTFSVRPTDPGELVNDEVKRDAEDTEVLLAAGLAKLATALARETFRSPRRVIEAAVLAWRVSTPGLKGRLWPLAYLMEAAFLAGRLRAKGVRHLHNHFGEGSATVAMLASVLTEIPFSLTVHGPREFDVPTELSLGEKVHRSAFTVAVCEYGRSQLFRWTDRDDWHRVRVVRCGLDATFLGREPTPVPATRKLVCVGRLAEQKGQLLLVEAAGLLAAEGLTFEIVLAGDGPMRGPIERRIATLGLGEHVRLDGWMDGGQVRREIESSRALVLPSFAEGLPVVLMEALALGRPAIGTYVAGIPELLTPGVSGWLVPAGSVDALAAAMREALEASSADLERMGRAGAAAVAERHDGAAEAAKLSALFSGGQETPGPKGQMQELFATTGEVY